MFLITCALFRNVHVFLKRTRYFYFNFFLEHTHVLVHMFLRNVHMFLGMCLHGLLSGDSGFAKTHTLGMRARSQKHAHVCVSVRSYSPHCHFVHHLRALTPYIYEIFAWTIGYQNDYQTLILHYMEKIANKTQLNKLIIII